MLRVPLLLVHCLELTIVVINLETANEIQIYLIKVKLYATLFPVIIVKSDNHRQFFSYMALSKSSSHYVCT